MSKKTTQNTTSNTTTLERAARIKRSKEEIIADYDKKIKHHEDAIERFKLKKTKALESKTSEKAKLKELMEKLNEKNLTVDDMLLKLNEIGTTE